MASINIATLEAILALKDTMTPQLKAAEKGVGSMVKSFASLAAGALTVGAAIKFVKDSLEAQAAQEAAINKLNLALANQGKLTASTSKSLIDFSAAMQDVSTFADEVILSNEALLVTFGMSEDQVKKTTKAAMDYAAATGTDLTSATQTLGKAFTGNVAMLQRQGFQFGENMTASQKFEAAIAQVEGRFGGSALAATKTYTGQMAQLKNAFGDTQEAVGKFLGTVLDLGSSSGGAIGIFKSMSKFIGEDLVLALSEARAQFMEFMGNAAAGLAGLLEQIQKIPGVGKLIDASDIAFLDEFARGMKEGAKQTREQGDAAAMAAGKTMDLKNGVAGAIPPVRELTEAQKKLIAETKAHAEAIGKLAKSLSDLGRFEANAEILSDLDEVIHGLGGAAKLSGAEVDRFAKEAEKAGKQGEAWAKSLRAATGFTLALIPPTISLGAVLDRMQKDTIPRVAGEMDDLSAEMRKLGGESEGLVATVDLPMAAAKKATIDWAGGLDVLSNAFQVLGVTADSSLSKMLVGFQAGGAAADILKKAMNGLHMNKKGEINFGDMFKSQAEGGMDSAQKMAVGVGAVNTAMVAYKSGVLGGAVAGAKFGMAFGPMGAAIGAVAGGIIGFIGKAARLRAEMKKLKDEFLASQGGMEALRKKALETGVDIDKALNAKNPKAMKAAMEEATKSLAMWDKLIQSSGGSMESLKRKAAEAGVSLQAALSAKSADALAIAMAEITKQLDTWDEAHQKLQAAAEKYGITIEEMGPAMARQELDKLALGLKTDFDLLVASGVNVNTVIARMGPNLSEFVNTSVAAGQAIPEAMRGMIDSFIAQGQLLDANGRAFNSAEEAGITFSMTMTEMFKEQLDAINRLVAALTGISIPPIRVPVQFDMPGLPDMPRFDDPGGQEFRAAAGFTGMVTRPTRFLAGEAGPEHVSITPQRQMAAATPAASGGGQAAGGREIRELVLVVGNTRMGSIMFDAMKSGRFQVR